jgi:hypothetical protein
VDFIKGKYRWGLAILLLVAFLIGAYWFLLWSAKRAIVVEYRNDSLRSFTLVHQTLSGIFIEKEIAPQTAGSFPVDSSAGGALYVRAAGNLGPTYYLQENLESRRGLISLLIASPGTVVERCRLHSSLF